MANNINWGKIYESTAWGSGVDNSIGWGDSYADLAGGGPKNTLAPVISGTAERGETLTSTTGTWTGTGTITYAYQWKRNGADISGATSSTYVLVAADDNALMTCVVSATDTEGTKSATSNTLGPVLAAPLNLTSPVASGTAQVGETLSTTDGTWQGIATITFAYQWRRDAANISGATSSTYTLVAADYATDVDCVVTATNGLGSASADSNDILNIAGTTPVITSLPTISGTIEVLQTITATLGSVTGVPTPTSSLQWQISDDGVSGWSDIVGETSTTYTISVSDDDKYLRVVQTATNAEGSDVENSAATTQVAGSAPIISGVPTISSQTQVGETITATAASVSGVPTPTTSWQWQRSADGSTGWANISGATSSTYTLVSADDTNYVRAVQTETNAVGSDSANSAASAQISSAPAYDYLLDDYSGAAAAYSLRLLDSTYSGNAIKVRRASDNAEQDIAFSNNELDTATLETFASGTDAFVTTWYDQSGNGYDAAQATASAQPKIVSGGSTILENGKAAIDWDGSNVWFKTPLFTTAINQPLSYFITAKIDTTNNTALIDGYTNGKGLIYRTASNGLNYAFGNTLSDASVPNTQLLFSIFADTTASSIYNNGNLELSGNLGGSNLDGITIGNLGSTLQNAGYQLEGSMQELILYPSNQNTNRTGIETNINDFYSIY